MSNVGYRFFTEEEDALLVSWDEEGAPLAYQSVALKRPVGSIKSRRRILGLCKSKPAEPAARPLLDQDFAELEKLRRFTFLFCAGCLAVASAIALFGGAF